jgi:hypothetical protein
MKSTINQKNIGKPFENSRQVGVYKMLDTLKTVKKFQQIYNLLNLGSGYIQVGHFDYGPFSRHLVLISRGFG